VSVQRGGGLWYRFKAERAGSYRRAARLFPAMLRRAGRRGAAAVAAAAAAPATAARGAGARRGLATAASQGYAEAIELAAERDRHQRLLETFLAARGAGEVLPRSAWAAVLRSVALAAGGAGRAESAAVEVLADMRAAGLPPTEAELAALIAPHADGTHAPIAPADVVRMAAELGLVPGEQLFCAWAANVDALAGFDEGKRGYGGLLACLDTWAVLPTFDLYAALVASACAGLPDGALAQARIAQIRQDCAMRGLVVGTAGTRVAVRALAGVSRAHAADEVERLLTCSSAMGEREVDELLTESFAVCLLPGPLDSVVASKCMLLLQQVWRRVPTMRVPAAAQFLLDADSGAHKQAFAKRERLLLQAGAAAGDA